MTASSSKVFAFANEDIRRVERVFLKDNTAELLRDYIVSGRVEPGAKLVERQLSTALGLSRMPIRDALMKLEQEGLVISRPAGRFVVQVNEDEARQLTQVRTPLEYLAVELATLAIDKDGVAALKDSLRVMKQAARERDRAKFVRADVAIHRTIWTASRNKYLQDTLKTIFGPLLVAISNSVVAFEWVETLAIHNELVEAICSRDLEASRAAIARHMDSLSR